MPDIVPSFQGPKGGTRHQGLLAVAGWGRPALREPTSLLLASAWPLPPRAPGTVQDGSRVAPTGLWPSHGPELSALSPEAGPSVGRELGTCPPKQGSGPARWLLTKPLARLPLTPNPSGGG